jgi:hypothetical protein
LFRCRITENALRLRRPDTSAKDIPEEAQHHSVGFDHVRGTGQHEQVAPSAPPCRGIAQVQRIVRSITM